VLISWPDPGTAAQSPSDWNQFRRYRVRASNNRDARRLPPMNTGRSRPTGLQAPGATQETGASRPKLGRQGRREIGRALEAMYEDVVKQGVPPRIVELLKSLDARARSNPESPSA